MNLQLVAQTNKKGQFVIPKVAREKLGITEGTLLEVVVRDQGLYIYPIKTLARDTNSHESFLKLLGKTAGAWGEVSAEEKKRDEEQHKLELEASESGKQAW